MNNIIVGMGEALWDVLPEGKKIGGAPANFAYHVSQFGFDSRVVSAVGNDELGDEIMEVFKEKQLKNQIERVDYPTGTVQVTLDDEGVPCYEIKEGVAWDNIPFTDELKYRRTAEDIRHQPPSGLLHERSIARVFQTLQHSEDKR